MTVILHAEIYRMVMPSHTCPYGIKAKHLLRRHGYTINDIHLTSRAAVDAFKAEHNVASTPQIFIDGTRIGGYDDLRRHLGYHVPAASSTSYKPVIAIFSVAFLLALAIQILLGKASLLTLFFNFLSLSMVLLAMQKLRNVESFSTMFLNYDVLAKRFVPYAYLYPYAELTAGLLMLTGSLMVVSIPTALTIGTIGAWSVYKAVYIEKRELKCACVGGDTNVPLGFVSLTENLMMIFMALAMLFMEYQMLHALM